MRCCLWFGEGGGGGGVSGKWVSVAFYIVWGHAVGAIQGVGALQMICFDLLGQVVSIITSSET
jgi:hypothetical protein